MRRSFFIFLVVFSFYGYAQSPVSYSVKHYTDANGLPQNSIKSIAKDDVGYLWLATEAGLTRFDGENFILFDKSYTNTRSSRSYNIRRDLKTSALYAQTEYHELNRISKGRVSPHPIPFEQVFPNFPSNMQVQELPIMNPEKPKSCIQINAYTDYTFKNDSLFFNSPKQLIAKPFKRKSHFNFFISGKQLFYEADGIFTLIENGQFKGASITGDLLKAKGNRLKNLKVYWNTATDQVFFSQDNAIYLVTYKSNSLETKLLVSDFDVEKQQIRSLYYDNEAKKLFLGSPTQGLFVLQLHQFYSEKPKDDINRSVKYALYPFSANEVLFANGDLLQTNGKTTHLPLITANSRNFAIAIDYQKNIWTLKDSFVHKLSPSGDQLLQTFNLNEETSSIYIDEQNLLWIGTFGGIYTVDLTNPNASPKLLLKLANVTVLKKLGESLWIGTYSGLFNYNLRKKTLRTIPQMGMMHIRDIIIRKGHREHGENGEGGERGESDAQIWICTYGDGFYLYANNRLKKMPSDRNGYLNTAHCILEDAKGFFWISTNKGLFQVAINDLLAYSDERQQQVYYQYYNESFGFNVNEFNGGCQPCGAILMDGNFIFPSLIGSVIFNPLTFKPNLPNSHIYIDRIFRDNESIKLADTITIDQYVSRLNIWVSSPYFGNPDNQNLEYKLAKDASWAKLDGTSIINFSALSPGKHELIIKKLTGFGNRITYKKLTIIVKPYFYQSWWFIGFITLYVLSLIAFFFKKRTKLIIKRNEDLELLVKERTLALESIVIDLQVTQHQLKQQTSFQKRMLTAITHDLKSPLRYMTIIGKQLYQREGATAALKENIRAMYFSAQNMYYFTENLLNYSKLFINETKLEIEQTDLNALVTNKINIFSDIASHNHIVIENNICPDFMINTNKVLLAVIVHNLLDNAVKFSENGTINFSIVASGELLKLVIKDSGPGMPAEIENWFNSKGNVEIDSNGLGLKMVKEFASRINLSILVKSNADEGTTFELIFY